jgi:hypothetical protein
MPATPKPIGQAAEHEGIERLDRKRQRYRPCDVTSIGTELSRHGLEREGPLSAIEASQLERADRLHCTTCWPASQRCVID